MTAFSFDRNTLVKLLVAATALHDELDDSLSGSNALHDHAESLGRALLSGQAASLAPLLSQFQVTSASFKRAAVWLGCIEQNLTLLNANPAGPVPAQPGLNPSTVEGLLAIIDGLALLTPWGQTDAQTHQHLRVTRAIVAQVIQAALQGDPTTSALTLLSEQQSRLLTLGEGARLGACRLGEAIEHLRCP